MPALYAKGANFWLAEGLFGEKEHERAIVKRGSSMLNCMMHLYICPCAAVARHLEVATVRLTCRLGEEIVEQFTFGHFQTTKPKITPL
jgi:hypothetical protein